MVTPESVRHESRPLFWGGSGVRGEGEGEGEGVSPGPHLAEEDVSVQPVAHHADLAAFALVLLDDVVDHQRARLAWWRAREGWALSWVWA